MEGDDDSGGGLTSLCIHISHFTRDCKREGHSGGNAMLSYIFIYINTHLE